MLTRFSMMSLPVLDCSMFLLKDAEEDEAGRMNQDVDSLSQ